MEYSNIYVRRIRQLCKERGFAINMLAKRAGIKHIILCQDNKKDIEEIPTTYLNGVEFHYVNTVMDVLDYALLKEKVDKPIEFRFEDIKTTKDTTN